MRMRLLGLMLASSMSAASMCVALPAAAQTAFEDFESLSPKDTPLASLSTAVGVFTPGPAGAGNVFISSPGYPNYGAGNNPTTSSILTANGDEDFILNLLFPANTISFDVYLNDFGPASASFYNGSTLLGTINYPDTPTNFFANQSFTSVGPLITRFTFTSTLGGILNTGLDNVRITAVPEPATWALMIGGMGAIGGAVRRRRHFRATVTA